MSVANPEHFIRLPEPERSCVMFLRDYLKNYSPFISESVRVNTPFFYYKSKSLAFLSYDPKTKEIYLSFTKGYLITHAKLRSEGRKLMKIFRVDAYQDIDLKSLNEILDAMIRKGYTST